MANNSSVNRESRDDAVPLAPQHAASGAARFIRRLRGQPDAKETAFAIDLARSETSSETFAGDVNCKGTTDSTDDTSLEKYYVPIDSYEGRHRYDPRAKWTEEEERALVRRLDWRICGWCCLMFFALQLDRSNITQALSDNMLGYLGMTTNDYNTGQTIFYLCFLVAELPSQLVSKKLGPDNWIPIQMICWSITAS